MEKYLYEAHGLKKGSLGDATAGITGARVKLDQSYRAALVVMAASAAGNLEVTLRQHDAATAGNSKDLIIKNPIMVKLDSVLVGTKVDAPETANYDSAAFDGAGGLMVLEALGEELDHENGFFWISVDITAVAKDVAQLHELTHMKSLPAYEVEV